MEAAVHKDTELHTKHKNQQQSGVEEEITNEEGGRQPL